jgi:hypothetical protein
MLIIASDLHLTDGTSGETIEQGAFFLLRERLFSLAYDASWRAPNVYIPIDRIDLVLLGDILDVIRSSYWCSAPPHVRPWGNPADPDFITAVETVNRGILSHNAKSLGVIKSLSNHITVPAADTNHRPLASKDDFSGTNRVTVPVFAHYLVGNHDGLSSMHFFCSDVRAILVSGSVISPIRLSDAAGSAAFGPQDINGAGDVTHEWLDSSKLVHGTLLHGRKYYL